MHVWPLLCLSGLGFSLSLSRIFKIKVLGFLFLISLISIPVLTFIIQLVFPLDISAKLVCAMSLVGFVWLKKEDLRHPCFLFSALGFLMIYFRNGLAHYVPFFLDEFSYWATMPKQILVSNSLIDIPYKRFVSYTPGWSLLSVYPDLVFKRFLEVTADQMIYGPMVVFLGVLGSVHDLTKRYLHGLICFMFFLCFNSLGASFPNIMLVEVPGLYLVLIVFLTMLLEVEFKIKNLLLSFILMGAFFIKTPFLILALPVLVFNLLNVQRVKLSELKKTALIFLPVFTLFLLWRLSIQNEPVLFSMGTNEKLGVPRGLELATLIKMFRSYFQMVASLDPVRLFFYFNLFLFLFFKRTKNAVICFLVFSLFYFLSLYWMYLFSFTEDESLKIASFERYMALVMEPWTLLSGVMFFGYLGSFFLKWQGSRNVKKMIEMIFLVILIVGTSRHFYKRFHFEPHRPIDPFLKATSDLYSYLDIKEMPRMITYNRGSFHGEMFWSVRNASLFNERQLFDVQTGYQNGELGRDLDPKNRTDQELKDALLGADILWIHRSDKKMDLVLKAVFKTCPEDFSNTVVDLRNKTNVKCIEESVILPKELRDQRL